MSKFHFERLFQTHMQTTVYQYIKELKKGTETNNFSTDVLYQKLYVFYTKIPFIKRYLSKLRRRLEIINLEDERYLCTKNGTYYSFRFVSGTTTTKAGEVRSYYLRLVKSYRISLDLHKT